MNCSEMKMSVGQMTAEKGKNQERDTDQEKKKKEVERDMLVRGILEGNIPGEDMIEKDIVEEEIWGKKRWDRMTEEKYQQKVRDKEEEEVKMRQYCSLWCLQGVCCLEKLGGVFLLDREIHLLGVVKTGSDCNPHNMRSTDTQD